MTIKERTIEETVKAIEGAWSSWYFELVSDEGVSEGLIMKVDELKALASAYREQAAVTRVVEDYVKVAQCTCDADTTCWKHLFEYNLNFLAAAVRRGESE